MTVIKGQLKVKAKDGSVYVRYPETSADIVKILDFNTIYSRTISTVISENNSVLEALAKLYLKLNSIPNFSGATASNNGTQGFVPAPFISDNEKYLKGDGTWSIINTAESAKELVNTTKFICKLDSESDGNFKGNNNCTLGITGTLPVLHGGTGTTSLQGIRTSLFPEIITDSNITSFIALSDSNAGIITVNDVRKLLNVNYFGICNTDEHNSIKTITINDFTLKEGTEITVLFKKSNAVSNPSLKINNESNHYICYNNEHIQDSLTESVMQKNSIHDFIFHNNEWHIKGNVGNVGSITNITSYNNAFGICNSESNSSVKDVTIENLIVEDGIRVTVLFVNQNTADSPSLRINNDNDFHSNIYYRGHIIPANALQADSVYDFIHYNNKWYMTGTPIWT